MCECLGLKAEKRLITGRDVKGEDGERYRVYDTKANGNNVGRGKAMGKERFIRIKYA